MAHSGRKAVIRYALDIDYSCIPIRISPDLHAKAAVKAQARGESLNDFVTKAIEDEIEAHALA